MELLVKRGSPFDGKAPLFTISCQYGVPGIGEKVITSYLKYIRDNLVLVSPDAGAAKKTWEIAKAVGSPMIQCDKHRDLDTGKILAFKVNAAPEDIILSNNSIVENQTAGSLVGTLSTTDQDAGDSHSYSLVAGAGDTDNAAFTIVNNELQTVEVFDYEVKDV